MPDKIAKRGDMVLIERTTRATYVLGSGRGTEATTSYVVAKVVSVKKDGTVMAAAANGAQFGRKGHKWYWQNPINGACYLGSRASLTDDVDTIISRLGVFEFDSVEAARKALQPFKA